MGRLRLAMMVLLGLAGTAMPNVLLHKSIVEGLSGYQAVSPIQSADGQYRGFVASDAQNSLVDIYDSAGTITSSLPAADSLIAAIASFESDPETLTVYYFTVSHKPWPWAARVTDDNLYTVSIAKISTEGITTTSVKPECYSTEGQIEKLVCNLTFKTDDVLRISGLIFQNFLRVSLWEPTMGVTTTEHLTFVEYSLGLDSVLAREAVNGRASGYFGGDEACGVARSAHYYIDVVDDPWNSYNISRETFSITNCSIELAKTTQSYGRTKAVYSGDFLPNTPNDEVIYGGICSDLLGQREGITDHWACYRIDDDIVSEVWWIPSPAKFDPYFYFKPRNAIVGIVNGLSVNLLSCETGLYAGSIPLDHIMYHKAFLMSDQIELPSLFGVLGDSIYVYRMDILSDVEDETIGMLPKTFSLEQNYPNPFNPSTTIEFTLPARGQVRLTIYDLLGRELISLIDKSMSAGRHLVNWDGTTRDGSPVATGIYFYSLEIDGRFESRKMLLLK